MTLTVLVSVAGHLSPEAFVRALVNLVDKVASY